MMGVGGGGICCWVVNVVGWHMLLGLCCWVAYAAGWHMLLGLCSGWRISLAAQILAGAQPLLEDEVSLAQNPF